MLDYYLPEHVHFCCRGESTVLLNLREDDYILLDGTAQRAFRELLRNDLSENEKSELRGPLSELLDAGLLTLQPAHGRAICPTHVDKARQQIIDPDFPPAVRVLPTHVARFLRSCSAAAVRLRWQRLEHTVQLVKRRKERDKPGSFNIDEARYLTAVFRRLRCFFPRNYVCLYDSLALVEFLALHGVFPTWVFGVRLDPWAAHCWVQEQDLVLNDDPEEVAAYTPVMAM